MAPPPPPASKIPAVGLKNVADKENKCPGPAMTTVTCASAEKVATPQGTFQAVKRVSLADRLANAVSGDVSALDLEKSDAITVVVRVRPLSAKEQEQGSGKCLSVDERTQQIVMNAPRPGGEPSLHAFDRTVGESVGQEAIFRAIGRPFVASVLDGYNSTIFAYGQTGSGKTHTMTGPPGSLSQSDERYDERGLIPRSVEHLFNMIAREAQKSNGAKTFECSCSYLEIYNEDCIDLLDPVPGKKIALRENASGEVQCENATVEAVGSFDAAMAVLARGARNRHTGSTTMNLESSRSHSVFSILVESRYVEEGLSKSRKARFNLIDLAGSERQKDTDSVGQQLKEACKINQSLSTLGKVIQDLVAISEGRTRHVHYRDSKLTFLLRDSLGGNARTCIIAALSPSTRNATETLSTLGFASRAKRIKNKAVVNEDTTGSTAALQAEVRRLRALLAAAGVSEDGAVDDAAEQTPVKGGPLPSASSPQLRVSHARLDKARRLLYECQPRRRPQLEALLADAVEREQARRRELEALQAQHGDLAIECGRLRSANEALRAKTRLPSGIPRAGGVGTSTTGLLGSEAPADAAQLSLDLARAQNELAALRARTSVLEGQVDEGKSARRLAESERKVEQLYVELAESVREKQTLQRSHAQLASSFESLASPERKGLLLSPQRAEVVNAELLKWREAQGFAEQLEAERTKARTAADDWTSERTRLEREVAGLREEAGRQTRLHCALVLEKTEAQVVAQEAQKRAQLAQAELESLRSGAQLTDAERSARADLEGRCAELEKELAAAVRRVAEAEAEAREAAAAAEERESQGRAEVDRIQALYREATAEACTAREGARAEREAAQARDDRAARELAALRAEMEAMEGEKAQVEECVERLGSELEALRAEHEQLEQSAAYQEAQADELRERLEAVERTARRAVEKAEGEMERLRSEVARHERQAADAAKLAEALRSEGDERAAQTAARAEELTREKGVLGRALAAAEGEAVRLREEARHLRENLSDAEARYAASEEVLDESRACLAAAEERARAAQGRASGLSHELAGVIGGLRESEEERAALRDALAKAEARLEVLETDRAQLASEHEERAAELVAELDARHRSARALEADLLEREKDKAEAEERAARAATAALEIGRLLEEARQEAGEALARAAGLATLVDGYKQLIETLQAQKTTLETALREAEDGAEAARADHRDAAAALRLAREECLRLEASLDEADERAAGREEALRAQTGIIAELRRKCEVAVNEARVAEGLRARAGVELVDVRDRARVAEGTLRDTRGEVCLLTRSLEEARATALRLVQEKDAADDRLHELLSHAQDGEERAASAEVRASQAEQRCHALEAAAEAAASRFHAEVFDIRQRVAEAEERMAEAAERSAAEHERCTALEAALGDAEMRERALEARIRDLEGQVAELVQDRSIALRRADALASEADEAQRGQGLARAEARESAARAEEAAAQLATLQETHAAHVAAAAEEAARLRSQSEELAGQLDAMRAALSEASGKLEARRRVSGELREKTSKMRHLQERADTLEQANGGLAAQIAELAAERETLERRAAEADGKAGEALGRLEELARENATLVGQANPKQRIAYHMRVKLENEELHRRVKELQDAAARKDRAIGRLQRELSAAHAPPAPEAAGSERDSLESLGLPPLPAEPAALSFDEREFSAEYHAARRARDDTHARFVRIISEVQARKDACVADGRVSSEDPFCQQLLVEARSLYVRPLPSEGGRSTRPQERLTVIDAKLAGMALAGSRADRRATTLAPEASAPAPTPAPAPAPAGVVTRSRAAASSGSAPADPSRRH